MEGLKNSNKYTAIVKILGSNIGKRLQFTYKSSEMKSPNSIILDIYYIGIIIKMILFHTIQI
ncbi:hypothetical protein HZS_8070 [Henneguya salminicola]|nr:hypothetical protein HZS_8070 [Henneguya salminicola]